MSTLDPSLEDLKVDRAIQVSRQAMLACAPGGAFRIPQGN